MTGKHWHAAYGLAGYGPDASDGWHSADDVLGIANVARTLLDESADRLVDAAEGEAQSGNFERAWLTHKHGGGLDTLRANIDPKRGEAPLYRDKPGAWLAALTEVIGFEFPANLDIDGYSRLYIWECDSADCDDRDGGDE